MLKKKPLKPNKETIAAIKELDRSNLKKYTNLDELFKDLKEEK